MKKSRVYLLAVVLLVSFVSLGIFSCSKKKKLTLSSLAINVTPNPASVTVGNTENFTATALRDGSPTEVDFAWSVNPSTLGTITNEGVFTAVAAGDGTVVASAEGESGSAEVTVTPNDPIQVTFPCYIHKDDGFSGNHYGATKFWDDAETNITVTWDCIDVHPSEGGANSVKIEYSAGGKGWGTMGWVEPHDNDGNNYPSAGYDLTGATKLSFLAKSDTAGHLISVQVANFETATYPDSMTPEKLENISLQTTWTKHEINLTSVTGDLSKIQFGFMLTFFTPPYNFYIDEIKFEK